VECTQEGCAFAAMANDDEHWHYFYTGRSLYGVPNHLVTTFALRFHMCDSGHLENVWRLIDLQSGKRHLNSIQPLQKTKWVQPWKRSTEFFIHSRPRPNPDPELLATFIGELNAERNGGKTKISNKQAWGKFLNGTYYPNGKAKGAAEEYCQWEIANVTVAQAKQLLDLHPPESWMPTAQVGLLCCISGCGYVVECMTPPRASHRAAQQRIMLSQPSSPRHLCTAGGGRCYAPRCCIVRRSSSSSSLPGGETPPHSHLFTHPPVRLFACPFIRNHHTTHHHCTFSPNPLPLIPLHPTSPQLPPPHPPTPPAPSPPP
jgi:hypothetical protein